MSGKAMRIIWYWDPPRSVGHLWVQDLRFGSESSTISYVQDRMSARVVWRKLFHLEEGRLRCVTRVICVSEEFMSILTDLVSRSGGLLHMEERGGDTSEFYRQRLKKPEELTAVELRHLRDCCYCCGPCFAAAITVASAVATAVATRRGCWSAGSGFAVSASRRQWRCWVSACSFGWIPASEAAGLSSAGWEHFAVGQAREGACQLDLLDSASLLDCLLLRDSWLDQPDHCWLQPHFLRADPAAVGCSGKAAMVVHSIHQCSWDFDHIKGCLHSNLKHQKELQGSCCWGFTVTAARLSAPVFVSAEPTDETTARILGWRSANSSSELNYCRPRRFPQ